jgi:L-rhamnonate dehydratase
VKITEVSLVQLSGEFPVQEIRPEAPRVAPLDIYPELAPAHWRGPARAPGEIVRQKSVYLEVHTDEEITGIYGPLEGSYAFIVPREMRDFLLGQDPLATEKIWDQLVRLNRHSRSGYYMMAMSALDCALWDLKGKALGQPVFRLLGGPTQDRVPAYASMVGFSVEPEALVRRAREHQALGYHAQKWFFRYGPGAGAEGARRNVEMVQLLRQTVGEETALMFDACWSWDVPYAVDVGRRIAPYRPAWLEEPVPCDRLRGLRMIREQTGIPIATGEHAYTRWQIRDLLEAGAVDVVQADPDWCGGISELVKIAALCSAYDVPLCPHGNSLHPALHVAAACPPTVHPQIEFLVVYQRYKQQFMTSYLEPESGRIRPPESPGLGIEIDPARVAARKTLL